MGIVLLVLRETVPMGIVQLMGIVLRAHREIDLLMVIDLVRKETVLLMVRLVLRATGLMEIVQLMVRLAHKVIGLMEIDHLARKVGGLVAHVREEIPREALGAQ